MEKPKRDGGFFERLRVYPRRAGRRTVLRLRDEGPSFVFLHGRTDALLERAKFKLVAQRHDGGGVVGEMPHALRKFESYRRVRAYRRERLREEGRVFALPHQLRDARLEPLLLQLAGVFFDGAVELLDGAELAH